MDKTGCDKRVTLYINTKQKLMGWECYLKLCLFFPLKYSRWKRRDSWCWSAPSWPARLVNMSVDYCCLSICSRHLLPHQNSHWTLQWPQYHKYKSYTVPLHSARDQLGLAALRNGLCVGGICSTATKPHRLYTAPSPFTHLPSISSLSQQDVPGAFQLVKHSTLLCAWKHMANKTKELAPGIWMWHKQNCFKNQGMC